MTEPFVLAVAIGLLVASMNAFFRRIDDGSRTDVLRTFLGWFAAFVLAGLIVQPLAEWLLVHVLSVGPTTPRG